MSALRPCELRADTVYVSPRGLLVRLVPAKLRGMGSAGELFEFAYIGQQHGKRTEPDGFWLTAQNVRILRPGATL